MNKKIKIGAAIFAVYLSVILAALSFNALNNEDQEGKVVKATTSLSANRATSTPTPVKTTSKPVPVPTKEKNALVNDALFPYSTWFFNSRENIAKDIATMKQFIDPPHHAEWEKNLRQIKSEPKYANLGAVGFELADAYTRDGITHYKFYAATAKVKNTPGSTLNDVTARYWKYADYFSDPAVIDYKMEGTAIKKGGKWLIQTANYSATCLTKSGKYDHKEGC